MLADRDVAMAQLAGDDLYPFLGRRVLDPQEVFRQRFAEATVDLADGIGGDGAAS